MTVLKVSLVLLEPFGRILQMSWSPSRALVKTILVPSGDQAGSTSSTRLLVSLFFLALPSAFITKTSYCASSGVHETLVQGPYLANKIFEPSGDQLGWSLM